MKNRVDYPRESVNGGAQSNGNGERHGERGTVREFPKEFSQRKYEHPLQGELPDVILRMHSDLVDYGRERAIESGDVEPHAEDMHILEEHAEALAGEAYREAFDPTKHEHDRLREIEYEKLKHDRAEAELAMGHAAANVAELEEEAARAESDMSPPITPKVLMFSAVAGLALTIAPTLHDFIFITMSDDVLNWAVSILSSLAYGVFITWGLLESDDVGGRRTTRNWLGLAGGTGVPAGLGLLRVANSTGTAEILFAVALTVVEIGIVLLLESRAVTLRDAYREWAVQHAALKDITSRVEAARTQLTRRKQVLAEINDDIAAYIRRIEEVSVRHYNIDMIKTDALKAVRDGYHAGIAYNRGRIRGIGRVAK
jgi:hypothetical protein